MYNIYFAFTLILLNTLSCDHGVDLNPDKDLINVEISNLDVYEYKTGISGDEEGASIIVQAKYFEISEIIRNKSTQYEAVYRYKPISGYSGADYTEIQLSRGSDGASPPTIINIVKLKFHIN